MNESSHTADIYSKQQFSSCFILSNAEFSFAVSLIPPTFNIYLERNCSRDIFFFKSWFYIVHFYRFVNFVQSGQFH